MKKKILVISGSIVGVIILVLAGIFIYFRVKDFKEVEAQNNLISNISEIKGWTPDLYDKVVSSTKKNETGMTISELTKITGKPDTIFLGDKYHIDMDEWVTYDYQKYNLYVDIYYEQGSGKIKWTEIKGGKTDASDYESGCKGLNNIQDDEPWTLSLFNSITIATEVDNVAKKQETYTNGSSYAELISKVGTPSTTSDTTDDDGNKLIQATWSAEANRIAVTITYDPKTGLITWKDIAAVGEF